MTLFICLLVLVLALAVETFVLVRFAKRLLQFDAIFDGIAPVLSGHADELRKTVSSGLLEDHPEVVAFHQMNVKTLQAIESVIDSVKATRPSRPKLPANYRPPVVE